MKKITGLFVVLIAHLMLSHTAYSREGHCSTLLTGDHNRDTVTGEIELSEYNLRDYGNDHLAYAIQVVRIFASEMGCRREDINFAKTPVGSTRSSCRNLSENRLRTSLACYVESNVGYFWVHYDFFNRAQVFYSRWD